MILKHLIKSLVAISLLVGFTATAAAKDIVHDAEYYVLEAQNGEKWAAEDKTIKHTLDWSCQCFTGNQGIGQTQNRLWSVAFRPARVC